MGSSPSVERRPIFQTFTKVFHSSDEAPAVFRKNGGTLEQAQQIAAHASPKTTLLYDRSGDEI